MKASRMIELLTDVMKDYGDVDVMIGTLTHTEVCEHDNGDDNITYNTFIPITAAKSIIVSAKMDNDPDFSDDHLAIIMDATKNVNFIQDSNSNLMFAEREVCTF